MSMGKRNTNVPLSPIHPNDLQVLEKVLMTYLVYLKWRVPPSVKRDIDIQVLQCALERLKQVFASPQGIEGVPIFFTDVEIVAIQEAIEGFKNQLCRMVPPSAERDEVLEGLMILLRHFEGMQRLIPTQV
jgi:hypothetical protein